MKPPAFQCYADDLLAGTSDMTAEEFGVYWRLICHSWNKGGLPDDDSRLALMAGQCSGSAVAYAKTKFVLGPDGLLRNLRLETVRKDQENYRKMQSDKAHLRWDRQKQNGHAAADAPAQARQCSPSPSPTPVKTIERERHFPEAVVPKWDDVKRMADMQCITESVAREFFEHYDSKNLWANRHGTPVNVLGCLVVWNNNQKKINANPNRNQNPARHNPRLAGQTDTAESKRTSAAAAIAASET